MDYKNAGVDIEACYKSVELIKKHVQGTMRPDVLTNLGGFSGAFSMGAFKNMEKPTLVSGTDGVGTKLKLAFLLDRHDTIGIDCVAMCVNDIACAGGEPLFFLDYIACGRNEPEKIATIVSGVANGCSQAGAALIGGETAEMPGFYPEEEYDLAGFAVGIVDEKDLITGKDLKAGDVLIGMASSGVHSNGFSLVRKAFDELGVTDFDNDRNGTTAFVFCPDETSGCSLLAKAVKENPALDEKVVPKSAYVNGAYVDKAGIKKLASIPSREVLIAKMLGCLQDPIANFAYVLKAIADQKS